MTVIPRGRAAHAVMLCQHDHCSAFGPGTSAGAGCGSMLSLMSCVRLDFSSSFVTFKQRSGPVTGCINL